MTKLNLCPFCGKNNAAILTRWDLDGSNATWKYVKCLVCGAQTSGKWFTENNDCPLFYEEVRNQWNMRGGNNISQ